MYGLWGDSSTSFDPAQDIPDLTGKVILVTGGNTGLGKQYILEVCRHNPSQIWLASRTVDKAKAAVAQVYSQIPDAPPIEILEMDLASLSSVKKAAKEFLDKSNRLDILMLNAGLLNTPPNKTEDGYEIQFGTNYLGHVLFTKLLLPTIEKTTAAQDSADARIVILSSAAYQMAPSEGIKFETLKTPFEGSWDMTRYGQSKLAVMLWARRLAQRYPDIKTASVHPGAVYTDLGRSRHVEDGMWSNCLRWVAMKILGGVPAEVGVKNQLWASFTKDLKSGDYYIPIGVGGTVNDLGKNDELAEKLWEWTEEELKPHLT